MSEGDCDSYFVSWGGFQRNIKTSFAELAENNNFSDVTLACDDGKQLLAHKVVLCSSSKVFKQLLMKNPHQHPLLYLRGVHYADLYNLVQFVYHGEAMMLETELQGFTSLAEDFGVEGLGGLFIQPTVAALGFPRPDRSPNLQELATASPGYETDLDNEVFTEKVKGEVDKKMSPRRMPKISSGVPAKYSSSSCEVQTEAVEDGRHRRGISAGGLFKRSKSKERRKKKEQVELLTFGNSEAKNRETGFYCSECDEHFKFKLGMIEHIDAIHKPPYECLKCDIQCATKMSLHRHKELKDHY